ncbi:helix-turn-helix domain-containing protein [Paenibacillus sacheonensis]|uniref:DNA topoisomerase (ATP-hydrolyzing) n=1 Tax=Paenibacillus sacheonensis TaxID=742054 RepID=A0A7X4YV15_9BACL|nr:helix-turn-helix domain-containing protein [Paenibacillus sacheonensis]MBM7566572.1 DNA gyrase subunit B [Paenibacillus sacheonensis]NBC73072.1 helix-turn-helix domain-containing protein [Paenibacillus sacheonensis]
MNDERNFGAELDWLKAQVLQLQDLIGRPPAARAGSAAPLVAADEQAPAQGAVHYAGTFRQENTLLKWEPQERIADELLRFDSDRAAKVLAALGHKQRLDILRSLLEQPQTGTALVEQLQMGTTGQLYHHIKAMAGADLLRQEERGGAYSVQPRRLLPILLLLAAVNDLSDTSDYIDMTAVRERADDYLGSAIIPGNCDPHALLWAVLENALMEYEAGYCSDIDLFLHDTSITVADNGRGIPTSLLGGTGTERTWLHAVMTDLRQLAIQGAEVAVPGSAKGINIAVVNAMSTQLQVEVRREGKISRQSYKHGIPQHPLLTIGMTAETGASVTFEPDPELFAGRFDRAQIQARAEAIRAAYPALRIHVHA